MNKRINPALAQEVSTLFEKIKKEQGLSDSEIAVLVKVSQSSVVRWRTLAIAPRSVQLRKLRALANKQNPDAVHGPTFPATPIVQGVLTFSITVDVCTPLPDDLERIEKGIQILLCFKEMMTTQLGTGGQADNVRLQTEGLGQL